MKRQTIALALASVALLAAAPGATIAGDRSSTMPAISAPGQGEGRLILARFREDDPEARGACIHSVSNMRICNDITRRFCISGGFALASFYEGQTCDELKRDGYY